MGALSNKSFVMAVMVVEACKQLQAQNEFVLSKQLLRSGTSVGAMVRESEFAQSKADFINKLYIALKEANETVYWLDLLKSTDYITDETYDTIFRLAKENIKLLVTSIQTTKKHITKNDN